MTAITKTIAFSEVVTSLKQHPKETPLRPKALNGRTYKLRSPSYEEALYVTINDYDGRPFEIFINSKNMESFQWILALTRVTSAVFRSVDDPRFLLEEFASVWDPKGGAFIGGKFVPSIVAQIGQVIEEHLIHLGLVDQPIQKEAQNTGLQCPKCQAPTLIKSAGCEECTSCDYNRCG